MTASIKLFLLSLVVAFAAPGSAQTSEISADVRAESDGTRTLVHEAVINAPVDKVWWALSTEEGWKTWGPRFALFDLRHGGSIETGYHDGSTRGDARNIKHRIIAFVPNRLLAIRIEQAPAGGPVDIETLKNVWGVYELEPIGDERTLLRITGVGYLADESSSKVLEFFKSGNVYSINILRQNLAEMGKEAAAQY